MVGSRPRLRIGALLALLAALVSACGRAPAPPPQGSSPFSQSERDSVDPGTALGGRPAPDFTLVDQYGQTVSLRQFRGKVVVLAFVDSQCTNICPLTTASMVQALDLLGPQAAQVQLLAVNVNATANSVADVAAYSRIHGLMNRWLFLTGSLAHLRPVWNAYGVEVASTRISVVHTAAVYIIDRSGRERRLILSSPDYGVVGLEAANLAKGVRKVLGTGSSGVSAVSHPSGQAPASPKDAVTLDEVSGGRRITLGPGHTRLVVFFASWLPSVFSELAGLGAVDSARVPVVAVDVQTVEASRATADREIAAAALPFPVVADATGRVADAYGVQDLPWLVLVSAGGRILWSHDGWLPAAQLRQAIAAKVGP